jgi:hypothetical protein
MADPLAFFFLPRGRRLLSSERMLKETGIKGQSDISARYASGRSMPAEVRPIEPSNLVAPVKPEDKPLAPRRRGALPR